MAPDSLIALAEDVVAHLKSKKLRLNMAEAGTGGLASAVLTTISGSSVVFDHGLVCYSNESKIKLLGVSKLSLEEYGSVSEEVVKEMALGGLGDADLCLSESCIAGPGGGTEEKPVGLCYLALATKNEKIQSWKYHFKGDRRSVRVQVVASMMNILLRQ